jgi:hypothetical protein
MSGLDPGTTFGRCTSCGRTVLITPSGSAIHTTGQPCPTTGQWAMKEATR